MTVLEATDISKSYFRKKVLCNVTMDLEPGRIIGLLGPNGSGKTTLLKVMAGLVHPTGGSIRLCGRPIGYAEKAEIAFLPDGEYLYPWMTVADAKRMYASLFGNFSAQKFDRMAAEMELDPGLPVKALSRGGREKLALALTLARSARLVVLDEPLSGVDPIAREEILGAILKGFDYESTIILASHIIREIEQILDEVHFIDKGRIVFSGSIEAIRDERNMTLDAVYREVFSC